MDHLSGFSAVPGQHPCCKRLFLGVLSLEGRAVLNGEWRTSEAPEAAETICILNRYPEQDRAVCPLGYNL